MAISASPAPTCRASARAGLIDEYRLHAPGGAGRRQADFQSGLSLTLKPLARKAYPGRNAAALRTVA